MTFCGMSEKQEVAAVLLHPDRPFAPVVAFGERLDLGVRRDQLVERRVEPFDAWRGVLRNERAARGKSRSNGISLNTALQLGGISVS